ncbi:MAG: hypothetical protein WCT04_20035 [Planctomycetota bacterium]
MPAFSPGTDKIVTFAVRFVFGVIVGVLLSLVFGWSVTMRCFANSAWSTLLLRWLLWGGVAGLIFGFTSAKDDRQWLE